MCFVEFTPMTSAFNDLDLAIWELLLDHLSVSLWFNVITLAASNEQGRLVKRLCLLVQKGTHLSQGLAEDLIRDSELVDTCFFILLQIGEQELANGKIRFPFAQ